MCLKYFLPVIVFDEDNFTDEDDDDDEDDFTDEDDDEDDDDDEEIFNRGCQESVSRFSR